MKGILGYETQELVSVDYRGENALPLWTRRLRAWSPAIA